MIVTLLVSLISVVNAASTGFVRPSSAQNSGSGTTWLGLPAFTADTGPARIAETGRSKCLTLSNVDLNGVPNNAVVDGIELQIVATGAEKQNGGA